MDSSVSSCAMTSVVYFILRDCAVRGYLLPDVLLFVCRAPILLHV